MRLVAAAVCVWLFGVGGAVTAGGPPGKAAGRDAPRVDKPDPKQVLRQVLRDVVTNPDLKYAREFYGTPGDRKLALNTDSPVAWPRWWWPKVPGHTVRFRSGNNPVLDFVYWYVPGGVEIHSYVRHRTPRLLAVQLNTFNLDPERAYDDQVCVSLFNIGGDGGEAGVIGGCIVYYTLKREKGEWAVEYAGSFDP